MVLREIARVDWVVIQIQDAEEQLSSCRRFRATPRYEDIQREAQRRIRLVELNRQRQDDAPCCCLACCGLWACLKSISLVFIM